MQALQGQGAVGAFTAALDGNRARFEALRLRGVRDAYTDLTARFQDIPGVLASMRHVEHRALIVEDVFEEEVWRALLSLQTGRRLLAHAAMGFIESTRVALRVVGQPRMARTRPGSAQGAIGSVRAACALAIASSWCIDAAVAAIGPGPVPVDDGHDIVPLFNVDAALPAPGPGPVDEGHDIVPHFNLDAALPALGPVPVDDGHDIVPPFNFDVFLAAPEPLDDGHGIDQLFNLDALLDAPEPVDEGYDIDQFLDLDAFLAALNRGEFDDLHDLDLDLDLDAALAAVEPVDDDYDIDLGAEGGGAEPAPDLVSSSSSSRAGFRRYR
jgi:hypothetical protein